MIDWLIVIVMFLAVGWTTWPPRGDRRPWLLAGLLVAWLALVVVGIRRGIEPGYWPWLLLLSLIGALVVLLLLWSLTNLLGRSKQRDVEQ